MTTAEKPHRMLHISKSVKGRPHPALVTRVTQEEIRNPTSPSKFGDEFPAWQFTQFSE